MKTKLLLLTAISIINFGVTAQTSVPDDAFETYLETHDAAGNVVSVGDANSLGDGIDGNNLVTTSKINVITNLYLGFLNIEDLTGLEDFTALEDFAFYGNNVSVASVNLPALANLKKIYLESFPNLSSIDVSNLSNLEDVTFQNLSALSSLDLSSNTNLVKLRVSGSSVLANLNTSNLISLEDVFLASSTMITSLDFTSLTGLKKLQIQQFTALSTLNITGLSTLEELSVLSMSSTSLDLSTLTGLKNLVLSNNTLLSTLNIKTGTTATIDYVQLNGNQLLTCVEVDAGIPINGMSTWNQSNGAIFNEDCANPSTYVPDDNFEAFLEANSMGNGIANDDKVTTSNINTVTTLDVSNQSISDLTGIQDFDALKDLKAIANALSEVNLELNINLEKVYLNDNTITDINVSKNVALKQLWVRNNAIKILDVSKNVALEWLVCSQNNIENLDLSLNTNLTAIEIHTNDLKTLNLKNVSSSLIFLAQGNPSLSCIQVDNPSVWSTNFSNQLNNNASFSSDCFYPTTNIPDAVFENYLETHDRDNNVVVLGDVNSMGNGVANDQTVFTHRINTVTRLDISNLGLASITGLEDFRDLEIFGAFGGNPGLTSADFSSNLKLKRITFSFNSAATNVTFGNLPDVTYVQLGYNNISSVDISGLPSLEEFKEFNGLYTNLNTSANTNLKILSLTSTPIAALNLTLNSKLENLTVAQGMLTSLNLSNNLDLKTLSVTGNKIVNLDVSNNTKLTSLVAKDNLLESLNINNGNNTILPGSYGVGISNYPFDIRNNPSLTCVEVSDLAYANANWTAKDPGHTFSTDCSTSWSVMTTPLTTAALLAISGLDADNNGIISLAEAAAYSGILDLSNSGITDVEGLLAFSAITTLNISGNGISDLSPLTGSTFTVVSKYSGLIKTAKKSNSYALQSIIMNDNNFEVLDLNSFTNLLNINISNNPNLKTVSIQNANNANMVSFIATNTPNLSCILVDDSNASYLSSWIKDAKTKFVASAADCRSKVLSTEEVLLLEQVNTYPNPVENILNIEINSPIKLNEIAVISLQGSILKVSKETRLDISALSPGIYIVKISTDKATVTKKIIKK